MHPMRDRPSLPLAVLVPLLLSMMGCTRPPAQTASAAPEPVTPTEASPPALFRGRAAIRLPHRPALPGLLVEVARTAAERAQGLMYRDKLGDDAGMLFVMPGDDTWGFYMRNTYIALDMVFVDADFVVVGVVANVPPLTETTRRVERPSRYVLELRAHRAAELGLVPGARVDVSWLPDAVTGAAR